MATDWNHRTETPAEFTARHRESRELARFIVESFGVDAKAHANREIGALPGTRDERTREQQVRYVALNMVIRGEA